MQSQANALIPALRQYILIWHWAQGQDQPESQRKQATSLINVFTELMINVRLLWSIWIWKAKLKENPLVAGLISNPIPNFSVAVLLFITRHYQIHDLTPNFIFYIICYVMGKWWIGSLKVQLGSGSTYMDLIITYFDVFIGYFQEKITRRVNLRLQFYLWYAPENSIFTNIYF